MTRLAKTGSPETFTGYARALALGGSLTAAAQIAEMNSYDAPVRRILNSILTTDQLGEAIDGRTAAAGFLESLRTASAFDAMLRSMRRLPVLTRCVATVLAASGTSPDQADWKEISTVTLEDTRLELRKSAAILIVSQEILRTLGGDDFLQRELQGAVALATDLAFLTELQNGASPIAASGNSAANIYEDVGALLAAVPLGERSAPFLVMSAPTAAAISAKATTSGAPAFPDMSWAGGSLANVPVIVSSGLEDDTSGARILLVDANQVAADGGTVLVSIAQHASIGEDSGTATVSLWQRNCSGLRVERMYGFQLLRSSAVAVLEGADYGDES